MATLYIFPDTNLLMHFQRLDELDWGSLSGAEDIVLVLAPAVVRELGKHKDQHPVRKLRQRARNLNSWLRQLRADGDKQLKNGVTLEIATKEPTAFLTGELDPSVVDDRIIASALLRASEGKAVAVATDDTILLHKLDAFGLRAIEIPESKRLADEPDELEAEARALRKQLAETTSRRPALDLVWTRTDTRVGEVLVRRQNLDLIATPAEMAQRFPALLTRAERARSPGRGGFEALPTVGLSDAMVEAHNTRLAKYHREYEAYYAKVCRMADLRRLYLPLALRLKNSGTASATHIQVIIRFPPTMTLLEEEPDFGVPDAPVPPYPPGPFGITPPTYLGSAVAGRSVLNPVFDRVLSFDRDAADVDVQARTAKWTRDRLPHGPAEDLEILHCAFAEAVIGVTSRLNVEIHAEELARPQAFDLALRFEEPS